MLAFAALLFSLLLSAVLGFPLAQRDVVNPTITEPHDGTVWVVGEKEMVTWKTDNFPPDSQITNPEGRVILGHLENDSLNLQLDHPLAANFSIRDGQVQITVPDVPPREDYIIVLMGDSGNASPAFAITAIKGSGSSSVYDPTSTNQPSTTIGSTSAIITGPSPPTATTPTVSEPEATTVPDPMSMIVSESMPTVSSSLPDSVPAPSSSASDSTTTAPAAESPQPVSTGGAWSAHNAKLWSVMAAPVAFLFLL
ncbi:hypothetical protein AGABI2DRAFT_193549 [Agaricus bisporus var. bisporus H97]|uniref:hypothetical protein n=1 Tax=Agaricus bisporus var. bisporus (strain H97 / ATCC MYA-4626 / FGSC 10389) TaxID=936046 RepID=UPI00029F6384|nr:hypothetical protein AGABI2DRAFT_193549 [Agaricus bisporus var. bisporus H97]EKV45572.1 hypothetical protein AGABI2DRAFT_193549 [Agaricus bisporus var. bisporus H97]